MYYCLLNQDRAIQFQCKGYIFYQESLIHQCFQKHILGEEVVLEGAKEQVVSVTIMEFTVQEKSTWA